MTDSEIIHLCQPDNHKGCSACCGLFNHTNIKKEDLAGFLISCTKTLEEKALEDIDNDINIVAVRDIGSHICPYQGFLAPGKPGCMIHPAVNFHDYRDYSLFGKKICDNFLCPAHTVLSQQQKKDLISYVNDWYLYTVAVIDPESYIWIHDKIAEQIEFETKNSVIITSLLSRALEIHAQYLVQCGGPLFFYALSEYNTGKINFSLAAETEKARKEREDLLLKMAKILSRKS